MYVHVRVRLCVCMYVYMRPRSLFRAQIFLHKICWNSTFSVEILKQFYLLILLQVQQNRWKLLLVNQYQFASNSVEAE